MPYATNGTLTTDAREIAISETWDTQTDWEAYQSINNVDITNGVLTLSEQPEPPDTADLEAWYDATKISFSDGAGVSTWTDETGNGNDLTAGSEPTYDASGINGNPLISFDGVSDYLDVSFGTTLTQPNHFAGVLYYSSGTDTDNKPVFDGFNGDRNYVYLQGSSTGGNGLSMFADGTPVTSNYTSVTSAFIVSILFDGSNSVMRVNGTQVASGDPGADGSDGLTVGASNAQGDFGDIQIGELLFYPQDKSTVVTDIESYLANKWGLTL